MSDSYSAVVGGKLNLKGGISKKKKKRAAVDEQGLAEAASSAALASSSDAPSSSQAAAAAAAPSYLETASRAGHTGAELRRMETKARREVEKLERGEAKSHRDRVKDFNTYLSELTEHYDLPKVSKGN